MSFLLKCINRGHRLRSDLATKGLKRLMLDECGAMSIDGLAKEAIAVLILIIIFAIVPKIGMMISSSLSKIITNPENPNLEIAQRALDEAQQKLQSALSAGVQDVTALQMAVKNAQEAFNSLLNQAQASAWVNAPNGAALWTQMAGLIQIAALILIVAIIIRAIYRLKRK